MKIAVIGAGAMGCRFGSALHNAGAEVWLFDIWKEHIDRIRTNGLIIHNEKETQNIKIEASSEMKMIPKPDLIMIFTKATHTENALKEALKIIDKDTIILTLQNGLGNIETISKHVNKENIIAGITNYASDMIGPGEIEAKGSGITKIMHLGNNAKNLTHEIYELLNTGGIKTEISSDIMADIWEKVAFNTALNTTTALTFLTVGDLGNTAEGVELAKDIAEEVTSVALKKGINADVKSVHKAIKSVFNPEMSGNHKTSMLQDRLFKRETEIETICGSVLMEAQRNDVVVPHIDTVYKLIKIIEKTYAKQIMKN